MKAYIFTFFAFLFCVEVAAQLIDPNDAYRKAKVEAESFLTGAAPDLNIKRIDERRNLMYKDGIIHIFLFEDGNVLLRGFPTTATEKDKFQVHLFYQNNNPNKFVLDYSGTYAPSLNIQSASASALDKSTTINRLDFAVIGPFTDKVEMTLKAIPPPKNASTTIQPQSLTTADIKIAKPIHVSIGTGLIYTTLRNPENIKTQTLAGGGTTLTADDPAGRGMLALMATYYPWGRNGLMLPAKNLKDRLGLVVGTSISSGSDNFRNILLGGQMDFSLGGSLVGGAHYGRRQEIRGVDYRDFEFNKSLFTGNLDESKFMDWDWGFFIGVQVDSRIFSKLFPSN